MTKKIFKISLVLAVIFLLFPVQKAFSQTIKGTITDTNKKPLEFVSVALLQPKDSLLVSYTSTGPDGKFKMSQIKPGAYMFQIYLTTYQVDQRIIKVSDKDIDLGILQLKNDVARYPSQSRWYCKCTGASCNKDFS